MVGTLPQDAHQGTAVRTKVLLHYHRHRYIRWQAPEHDGQRSHSTGGRHQR
jgi:hypothetical protein